MVDSNLGTDGVGKRGNMSNGLNVSKLVQSVFYNCVQPTKSLFYK